jgi:uncharacterized membrane protein
VLIVTGLLPVVTDVGAADQPDSLKLNTRFPSLKGNANRPFEWEVEIQYGGTQIKTFDLTVKGPSSFFMAVQTPFDGKEVSAIRIDPAKSLGETMKIVATPLPWQLPAAGEYTFTFAVSSGGLKSDIELKGTVTAAPAITFKTSSGRLNADATAGEESRVTLELKNTGTNELKQISFSNTKPEGWTVTFNPDKLDSLAAGATRNVDVAIKPSGNAISGDYMVNLTVSDNENSVRESLAIRTTVLTSGIWGWVGIGIVVLVVAGLAFVFWKFGRR